MNVTRKAWADFSCKSCGKQQRQLAEVTDSVAVAKVLEVLLNQSKGRPKEQTEDEAVQVVYTVIIQNPDETRTPVVPVTSPESASNGDGE